MWLTRAKLPALATNIVKSLVDPELIETENRDEVQADVLAVLEQYLRDEQEISNRARDLAAGRGGAPTDQNRIKRELARKQGVGVGDEAIDYLLNQLVEMLMHSGGVEEIFAQDHELRLAMRAPLRAEQAAAEQVDEVIRKRLKHVEEGSSQWEVEYQRLREEVQRRRS
ncbi:MAG TPA: DUF507 family protein [Polyangiaceae bacterium]|nr:DUF507 family protein [Polyangiaceae bacterium]